MPQKWSPETSEGRAGQVGEVVDFDVASCTPLTSEVNISGGVPSGLKLTKLVYFTVKNL